MIGSQAINIHNADVIIVMNSGKIEQIEKHQDLIPSVSPFALFVASYENSNIHMNRLASEDGLELPYQDQTHVNLKLSSVLSKEESYEMVYVGEGRSADFKGKDVAGKIVVAKPLQPYAAYSYVQSEAKKNGAKEVILVPPATIADFPYYIFQLYADSCGYNKQSGEGCIN